MLSLPAGTLQVEQVFFFCGHPIPPPHFANLPRGECCLPGPIPETQSLHFFAARMQSHGPNSPNQTPPCERRIQNEASAVAAVFKVSELLENPARGCWSF